MDEARVSIADVLGKLGRLHADGFLTDEEFEFQKSAFLGSSEIGNLSPAEIEVAIVEIGELEKLSDLVHSNVLSREEFEAQKASFLCGIGENENDEQVLVPIPIGWEWVLIIAGALTAIGSFLPWEQASSGLASLTRNGFQLGADLSFSPDGLIVMILGVIAALIGITRLTGRQFPRWLNGSPMWLGAVILFESISDERSLTTMVNGLRRQDPSGLYTVGYGVWFAIVGGALIAFAGLAGWWTHRGQRESHKEESPEADRARRFV